jgi:hypothetical protein
MFICHACQRQFPNSQAVKGHLKHCELHKKTKGQPSCRPQEERTPATLQPQPPNGCAPVSAEKPSPLHPLVDLMNDMVKRVQSDTESTRLKQNRETLFAMLGTTLVDRHCPLEGVITPEMAVAAKVAFLDELGPLPIEALSQTECLLRAESIRNTVWAPYFRMQQEQLEHQKAQLDRQKECQRQEVLRMQEDAAIQASRMKRKATFMELGVAEALKVFRSRGFADRGLGLFEWEIRGRLDILLTGDETEGGADKAIEAAIQGPMLEREQKEEQARRATRHRIVNQCVTLVVPVVEAALPLVTATVIKKFYETFGRQPSPGPTAPTKDADASPEKSSSPASPGVPTPDPVPTRQMRSADPIVDRDANARPSPSGVPDPLERRRSAS